MDNQKIIIVSAPSGGGKSTIVKHLVESRPVAFSVSATTRPPRQGEQDGIHYFFLAHEEFMEKVGEGFFLEWKPVYKKEGGHYCYGTPRTELDRIWEDGKTPVLDIDVDGAQDIKNEFGDRALLIFIQPPSLKTLRERLERRGDMPEDEIENRIERAAYEIDQSSFFDRIIVNDFLPRAQNEAENIVAKFLGMIPTEAR